MPDETTRSKWTGKFAYAALTATVVFLGLVLVGLAALTAMSLLTSWSSSVLLIGIGRILAVLLGVVWLFVIYGLIRLIEANEESVNQAAGRLARIEALLQNQAKANSQLIRLASLSDQTKSLIFHEREIDAVREALNDALIRQDYATAEVLIQDLAQRPGLEPEAQRMRDELADSKTGTTKEKLDSAVARVGAMIEQKDWPRALRASQRLLQMFPDSPQVTELPERIETAKTRHKRELLQAYGEAVRKNDVDRGIDLLRRLDSYLTPQEAAALEESARGVFRAKLHNLGVQFALSVTDQRWEEAIAVGEQIAKEYPNSRMANEVREKMEQLRARAGTTPQGQ